MTILWKITMLQEMDDEYKWYLLYKPNTDNSIKVIHNWYNKLNRYNNLYWSNTILYSLINCIGIIL